jgi:hypothetical protein
MNSRVGCSVQLEIASRLKSKSNLKLEDGQKVDLGAEKK